MAAPRALTSFSKYIDIDGIDMHLYGMVVHKVINPIPPPVESSVSIPGRDGAFDFSRVFGSRTITIEGEIIANNHSTLLTYIEEINKIIRLRSDGRTYKLIFSDQSDRYWNVRISYSDMQFKGYSGCGKTMRFSMRFLSPKPFAEKTTMSIYYDRLSINKPVAMYNVGNYKTPVNVLLKSIVAHNIVEDVPGYSEIHECAWAEYENCSVSYTSEGKIYGPSGTVVTQTNPAISSTVTMAIDTIIDKTKSFFISCFVLAENIGSIKLKFETSSEVVFEDEVTPPGAFWKQLFVYVDKDLVDPDDNFYLDLICDGTGSADSFIVNGTCIYYTDANYDTLERAIPYSVGSLPASDLTLRMFNNLNTFPYKNGQSTEEWNDLSYILGVTKNPIDDGNCLVVRASAYTNSAQYVISPLTPVQSGVNYRISIDYYLREITGTGAGIYLACYAENNILIDYSQMAITLTTAGSGFTTYASTYRMPAGTMFLAIHVVSNDADYVLYLKNIMVAYQAGETAPGYEPAVIFKQYYTGDIAQGDSLSIDNENGYCRLERAEPVNNESISNAMQYFSGDLFQLEPGYNFLTMDDARSESLTPEDASSGTLGILYSYRARFL